MNGKSLQVGKRLSLHKDARGWLIVGRGDDLERCQAESPICDSATGGITGIVLTTADGTVWYFDQIKWLGKEHCTALLRRMAEEA